jgi:hypothetical protein
MTKQQFSYNENLPITGTNNCGLKNRVNHFGLLIVCPVGQVLVFLFIKIFDWHLNQTLQDKYEALVYY